MGACATKFAVLKNTSTAPPPDVKCEVEQGEVNLVEEVAVEKHDAPPVDDEANRRQSLGHLLQEVKSVEEKKGSADCNDKESEEVNHVDAAEVKLEAVADATVQVERESAPLADGLESKCAEEGIPANQNVEMEAEKAEDKPAETEKPQENKAVEIPCADKAPETLETEKAEVKKPALDEETKVEEVKLAEGTTVEATEETPETPEAERSVEQCPVLDAEKKETDEKSTEIMETPEKKPEETPETPEAERSEEQCPALDAEKKETDEKSTEIMETPEKKPEEPEATEEQEPASEAEKKISEEKPCEISTEKPELPEMEKAADTDENMMEEKPAGNSKTATSEEVEDKHVLEPQTAETLSVNKAPETCSVEEEKPASDVEIPKAEEEKAK